MTAVLLIIAVFVGLAALVCLAVCMRSSQFSKEQEQRRMGYVGTQSRWDEANNWGSH